MKHFSRNNFLNLHKENWTFRLFMEDPPSPNQAFEGGFFFGCQDFIYSNKSASYFQKRYDATCVQTFKRNWKMFAKFPFVSRDVNNKFWKCLSSLSFKIAKLEFSFFFPFHKAINNLPCKLCKLRSLRLWWLCQIKMASTEGGDQPPESKQDSVRIGSTCFSINLNYVKSLLGIFEAAIIVSILCLTPSIYLI